MVTLTPKYLRRKLADPVAKGAKPRRMAQKTENKEKLFGRIALEKDFLTPDQLDEAVTIQEKIKKKKGSGPQLGEILIKKGYLQREEVDEIAKIQARRSRLDRIPGYRLKKKLGEGATGGVYKAWQISMDRPVAIKILSSNVKNDESYIKRFFREARSVAKLNHESIIKGIDVGETDGIYYFVMEYVEGQTLRDIMEQEGTIDEERAVEIALQIARALKHAARNDLVHRDMKPENIMINEDGNAKLCDLGLAKRANREKDSSLTQTGTTLGTPYYMSPEQATGNNSIDIRTDIYSLGATLYHAVTGEVPFEGQTPTSVITKHVTEDPIPPEEHNSSISHHFSSVVTKMMNKEQEDRYKPSELIDDLENLKDGKPPLHAEKKSRHKNLSSGKRPSATKNKKSQGGVEQKSSYAVLTLSIAVPAVLLIGGAFLFFGGQFGKDTNPDKQSAAVPSPDSPDRDRKNQMDQDGEQPPNNQNNADGDDDGTNKGDTTNDSGPAGWFQDLKKEVDTFEGPPEKARDLIDHIDDFHLQHSNTQWELKADRLRDQFLKEQARTYYSARKKKAEQLLENNKLALAYQVWVNFPNFFLENEIKERVSKQKKKLWNRIRNEFSSAVDNVKEHLKNEKFDKAKNILAGLNSHTLKGVTPELHRKRMDMIQKVNNKEEDFLEQQRERSEDNYKKFTNKFKKSVKYKLLSVKPDPNDDVNPDELKAPEKLISSYSSKDKMPLKEYRNRISPFREDLKKLREFRSWVREGFDDYMEEFPEESRTVKINNLDFVIKKREQNTVFLNHKDQVKYQWKFSKFTLNRRILWALRSLDEENSEHQMLLGLVHFYGDQHKKARNWFQKASKNNKDRAAHYLNLLKSGSVPESSNSGNRGQKSRNKNTRNRIPERNQSRKQKIKNLFSGDVSFPEKGLTKIHYSFSSKKQFSNDWLARPIGSRGNAEFSYVGEKNLVVARDERGRFLHRAPMNDRAMVKLQLSTPSGRNFGALISSRESRGYGTNYIKVPGGRGRRRKRKGKGLFYLSKFNFSNRGRDQNRLDRTIAVQIPKNKTFTLTLKLDNGDLSVSVNGKNHLNKTDDNPYQSGYAGAYVLGSSLRIHKATIMGYISRDWLNEKLSTSD